MKRKKSFAHRVSRRFWALLFLPTLLLASCTQNSEQTVADTIMINGTIYTVDDTFSVAEAVAIKNGFIIAVGSDDDILAYAGDATERIDLNGRTMVPGFTDSHAHLLSYAASLDSLDLVGTQSAEQIAELVTAWAADVEPGVWITGRGWDQNDWTVKSFPTHEILDAAAPDNPVVLTRVDGHASWSNALALEIAGISDETDDPQGGEIIKIEGIPTGVLIDRAQGLLRKHVPPISRERLKELLVRAVENCHAVGLVGNHEMGGGPDNVELIKKLIDEGRFDYRINFNYSAGLPNLDELLAEGIIIYGDGRLVIRSVKIVSDGALGSRGAALLEPYSDRPESSGLLITNEERIRDITEKCLRAGFQVATHAIGDRGNRITLNAYEQALQSVPTEDHRLRIEHAQIISPADIPRFKSLGVLPSMQPTHCTSDFPWALDRLGPERITGAYAWRKLLNTGVIIPGGSDFPVEGINPIWGFYSAVTRKHQDGTPENGYFPDQKLTREEALKSFTIWAATAVFDEGIAGSVQVGRRADLVVLDRDIMKVPEDEILGTRVEITMVDGKIVFRTGQGQ